MLISKRLAAVAGEINFTTMADIGTDHAYVPIFALAAGKIRKAVACDINPGPLETARKNIDAHGMSAAIETRLADGLTALRPGEADTAVLAGMGGMLIIDILFGAPAVTVSLKQLVVQPQHDVPAVRRYVHYVGFAIVNELVIYEDKNFYNVINCHRGADVSYNERDYSLGKITAERRDDDFMRYLESERSRLEKVLAALAGLDASEAAATRKAEVERMMGYITEIIG
jgi:tRNA (adenine22-N1)-methyltransferase